MPKISVIMSVYNGQKYLAEAVQSVINQTLKDWELIIVDDGSTDESDKIINQFEDERIKIIRNKENIGLTKSLNLALEQAQGEYIARLDSDDCAEPERLKKQYEFMKEHQEIVLVGSGVTQIGPAENEIKIKNVPTNPWVIKYELIFGNPIYHSTIFFRKQSILDMGAYDENYHHAQDFELYSRLIKKYQLANINEPLVKFRVHAESVVSSPKSQKIVRENALKIIFNNINNYIRLEDADYQKIKEILIIKNNKQVMSLGETLRTHQCHKKIWKSFIEKEKILHKERKILIPYYHRRRFIIFKRYLLAIKRKWS